jgi:ABC-type multidrug transport system ATPase subunit
MENAYAVATTTTIRILATPLRPDAGTARVLVIRVRRPLKRGLTA